MSGDAACVTVIVPAFNPGRYLRDCMEDLLRQTHRSVEIIVVDDGSTDGSVEELKQELTDASIRWFRTENRGKAAAVNLALDEMRGEYFCLQDADDRCSPNRLQLLLEALRENPDLAGVFSGYDLIIGDANLAPLSDPKSIEECREQIDRYRMPSHDPTGMYSKAQVGHIRFDEELRVGQGWDFILRVGEEKSLLTIADVLYSYRILETSRTRSDPSFRERQKMKVIRLAVERRGLDPSSSFLAPSGGKDNDVAGQIILSVKATRKRSGRLAALANAVHSIRASGRHGLLPRAGLHALFDADVWRRRLGRVRKQEKIPHEAAGCRKAHD